MKKWIDELLEFNLEGKFGVVFLIVNFIVGGLDIVLFIILNYFMVKGMLVYLGGVVFGKLKIYLGYVYINEI